MSMTTTPQWRRSAVETADACLYRYRQIYELGFEDTSDEARRGSAFHEAAHLYIERLAQAQQPADEDLARESLTDGFRLANTPAYLFNEVADLWWPFVERFELDLEAYLLAEERQAHGGYVWRPDLVYARPDGIEIVDFKTHWQVWPASRAKGELQARWYAWQAAQIWPGFGRYVIRFAFVRYGADVPVEFTPAEIDQVEPQVAASIARIEQARATGTWPASPGAHCGFCRLECPTVDDVRRAPVRVLDRLDAERIAGEALVLKQAVEARELALAAFCATEGAVTCNGIEYAHRPTKVLQFPIAPVMRVLTEQGITPGFTVGKTALRPYLTAAKYFHVRPALEQIAVTKVETRFSARKAGEETESQS